MSSKMKNYHSNSGTNNNSNSSKLAHQMLEQERNMLKITLNYVAKENDDLKMQLADMKMTVKHNKELLKEYIEKITNKDKVVEKMDATIEQLTTRMHSLEEFIKQLQQSRSRLESEGRVNTSSNKGISGPVLSSENISMPYLMSRENMNKNNNSFSNGQGNITGNINNLNNNTNSLSSTNNSHSHTRSASTNVIPNKTREIPPRTKTTKGNETSKLTSANSIIKNDDKIKDVKLNIIKKFFIRQSRIVEELSNMKDDLQFLVENKKKSKLNEKLEKSYRSMNSSMNDISLNSSFISNRSSNNNVKKKINLKDKFNFDSNKLQDFLNLYSFNKNVLLFVDSKNNIWEIIKRKDLCINSIGNCENISSVISGFVSNYQGDGDSECSGINKFGNLEIKDNFEDKSLNGSELDISKVTDFNLSHYIRDMNDN